MDQFEELFPRNENERFEEEQAPLHGGKFATRKQEKRQFVDVLLGVLRQWKEPVYVSITMRSDFVGEAASYSGLPEVLLKNKSEIDTEKQEEQDRLVSRKALEEQGCAGLETFTSNYVELPEALNQGLFLVSRMNPAEICEAIQGPLKVTGGTIENDLLTELVLDVDDNPAKLPVLQHALRRTWQQSAPIAGNPSYQTTLKMQHYVAIGKMEDAIDFHADETLKGLKAQSGESEAVTKRIFQAMTGYTLP